LKYCNSKQLALDFDGEELDRVYISMIILAWNPSDYSEDFQAFAEIAGVEKSVQFAWKFGMLEMTLPSKHDNIGRCKHMMKVRDFFGDDVYRKLCRHFGGFGRIKIPMCASLRLRIEAQIMIEKMNDGMPAHEAAKRYAVTLKTVKNRVARYG